MGDDGPHADRGAARPGHAQRVALARAVASAPDVLLVDEPAEGFDAAHQAATRSLVSRYAAQGGAVVWATRRLDVLLGLASDVTLLAGGRVRYAGSADALAARALSGFARTAAARCTAPPSSLASTPSPTSPLGSVATVSAATRALVWKTVLSGHPSTNGFETDLGARVRALRRERGLTLKGLGRLAGLSHPVPQPGRARPRPPERQLGRADRRRAGRLGRPAVVAAAPGRGRPARAQRRGRARRGRACASCPSRPAPRPCASGPRRTAAGLTSTTSQDGEMAIYVARGTLEVDLDGAIHALAEGDTLRFDGTIPHRLRRTGGTQTRALIIAADLGPIAPRSAGGSPPASSVSAARASAAIATPADPGRS